MRVAAGRSRLLRADTHPVDSATMPYANMDASRTLTNLFAIPGSCPLNLDGSVHRFEIGDESFELRATDARRPHVRLSSRSRIPLVRVDCYDHCEFRCVPVTPQ